MRKMYLLILVAASTVFANEVIAAWPTANATRCWSIAPGSFLKARIILQGGGFYTVSSILIEDGKLNNVGGGTAYAKGDNVYLTLNLAGNDDDAMWTSQNYIVVNKRSMVGQSESIGHDKNFADSSLDTQYESNPITLTPVACGLWIDRMVVI